jgi:hypothetical protein
MILSQSGTTLLSVNWYDYFLTGQFTLPDSIKYIGTYAFVRCPGLTEMTIPNSVDQINEGVFAHCKA